MATADDVDVAFGLQRPRAKMLVALVGRDGKRIAADWTEAEFERTGERSFALAADVDLPRVRRSVWAAAVAIAIPDGKPMGVDGPIELCRIRLIFTRRLHPDDSIRLNRGDLRASL